MNESLRADRMDRRGFVKCGLSVAGLLVGTGSAMATIGARRPTYLPNQTPLAPATGIAPAPALALAPLAFEVGSGIHPHLMVRALQEYFTLTLSPEFAWQMNQVQAVPRQATSFHQQFRSDYVIQVPLQPTQNRYGYFVSVSEVVRPDAQQAIRPLQDLNFYEIRRLIHAAELSQFSTVLFPASPRQPATPMDQQAFYRVAQRLYGLPNPETFTLLYTRLFTNGRNSFVGYCASRGPDVYRSPYKDVLIDNVPFSTPFSAR